ncbi:hypothetical protein ALC53_06077 [Atta colombica]|uniref:Uncharacterized protein n=1 Tax=Atta colombica TaxID=520822 RepID=A0A195BGJ8_9HYME|nr:hypothetical protein ALC53_06077 [Atta colombica]
MEQERTKMERGRGRDTGRRKRRSKKVQKRRKLQDRTAKGKRGKDSEEKRKKRGGWRICSRASSQANSQLVGQPPRSAEKRKGEQEDG